ncbi:hypothetical protein H6P81_009490 [Aristolochia fimbriata]|uniref:Uncharacterized protein n=1 Tax=Aristolochia fimbriata TaxID=158543 RepID=A0AAV7EL11_ARIFI|nr:hypothetical protein H6P81_009490 [Aristolochia fimbriata]
MGWPPDRAAIAGCRKGARGDGGKGEGILEVLETAAKRDEMGKEEVIPVKREEYETGVNLFEMTSGSGVAKQSVKFVLNFGRLGGNVLHNKHKGNPKSLPRFRAL